MDIAVQNERSATREVLLLVREAEKNRLYLERGFPNLMEWLVKRYKYSHSAANRRIQASRVLKDAPEVAAKVESGEMNVTTLSQFQTAIRRHELSGQKVSVDEKRLLLSQIEEKSSDQTQRLLAQTFPDSVRPAETVRAIGNEENRVSVVLDDETLGILKQLKNSIAHINPNASLAETIKYIAKYTMKHKRLDSRFEAASKDVKEGKQSHTSGNPIANPKQLTQFDAAAAAQGGKMSRAAIRRMVLSRGCEFQDPMTKRTCRGFFQVEEDHIIPLALGGKDEISNLRCLCKQHNLLMARKKLGARVMDKFWPSR